MSLPSQESLRTISFREDFPELLNERGLLGKGVEIGVLEGDYSDHLLKSWKGNRLYSVDPWRHFEDPGYVDLANVDNDQHERRYQGVKNRLSVHAGRSVIVRKTSVEASVLFGPETLDFVYLDAQHHYEAVVVDIAAWYPKIRVGGILAGHDYIDGNFLEGIFGVKSAVDEFVKANGLAVMVCEKPTTATLSWFVLKH